MIDRPRREALPRGRCRICRLPRILVDGMNAHPACLAREAGDDTATYEVRLT